MDSPLKYFADLRDPRVERTREHIAGRDSSDRDCGDFERREWMERDRRLCSQQTRVFEGFLKLPGGIPSHDTFNRVFSALDPGELERGFAAWAGSIAKLTAGEVIAIDGKALRGASEAGKKAIVHMVSAMGQHQLLGAGATPGG